ncbi:DUF4160 domain-containing protein [Candidatus Amarolinea dominans]|uniref:DUF4160 domain-containing protein n=1 Tax=Candidatus Amarolinea dominans TaxID=3140696 RepID=UPI0031CC9CA7
MPQISQFFGISIYMYYDEHNPPHFHAIYGKNEGQIGISPLALIEGKLSGLWNGRLYINGDWELCVQAAS